MRLEGAVVLAVGCGSPDGQVNNGLAAARAFAREGAAVCVIDRDQDAIDHARDRIALDHPGAATHGIAADVTDEEAVAEAVAACREVLGVPTVLYYNVGVVVNGGPDELTADRFRFALEVNLTGAFVVIRHVLPQMLEAGSGSIITIASAGGLRYMGYNYPAYAASKAGLVELTNSVGSAYARRGIRANSIAPGLIETPLLRTSIAGHYGSVEEMLAARHAASPTGRMGSPEDVAEAAVFLASEESRYVNATILPVDGGLVHSVMPPAGQPSAPPVRNLEEGHRP